MQSKARAFAPRAFFFRGVPMADAQQQGRDWAEAFVRRNPGCDLHEGILAIWFTQCFEHGYDQRMVEDLCDPFKDKVTQLLELGDRVSCEAKPIR